MDSKDEKYLNILALFDQTQEMAIKAISSLLISSLTDESSAYKANDLSESLVRTLKNMNVPAKFLDSHKMFVEAFDILDRVTKENSLYFSTAFSKTKIVFVEQFIFDSMKEFDKLRSAAFDKTMEIMDKYGSNES